MQTKISLGSFFIIIIAILMIIAIIISGLYVAKNVKPPQNFGSMANAIDEQQDEAFHNTAQDNNIEKSVTDNNNVSSIILNGWIDFNAKEGYGAERKFVNGKENSLLKYEDANNYKDKNYYLYIKNNYLGETSLIAEEGPYDGIMEFSYANFKQNENEESSILFNILISEKYNAIPRKSIKAELTDKMRINIPKLYEYSDYEVEKVDLDGDGKFEYFIALQDKLNKQIGKSELIAFNEEGEEIANLVNITNGYWAGNYDNGATPTQVDLNYLTYIDLDNDGKMEILTILPTWEGEPEYTVFKYENGKIIGSTVVMDLTQYP